MLTANTYLAAIEEALEPGDEMKLAGLLTPLKADYDFILLDSPPGKARLTFNALAASDLVVITCAAERMALDRVADMIGHIQRHLWGKYPDLEHQEIRILFTMYRNTTTHAPAVVASAHKIWRDNIFGVRIPHAAIFAQSYDQKQPVMDIAPRHPGALAYDALAGLLLLYEDA